MNQQAYDLEFGAIVAGLGPFPAEPADRWSTHGPDVQRIASAVFCSIRIDPSIVAFAVRRTAVHWGLPEDKIDVAVTVALLSSAARVMGEIHPPEAA